MKMRIITAKEFSTYKKGRKIGEGTFGEINVYQTPYGLVAGKRSLIPHGDGYPSYFLIENDMLRKFSSEKGIIDLKGVYFDPTKPEGITFTTLTDMDLVRWLRMTPIETRAKYMEKMVRTIGSAIITMHKYGFIHGDMKTNNILVKVDKGVPSFLLCDFGRSRKVTSHNMYRYPGLARFQHPNREASVFVKEFWALMVVCVDMLEGKILPFESIKNRKDVELVLKNKIIPNIFWNVFSDLLDGKFERIEKYLNYSPPKIMSSLHDYEQGKAIFESFRRKNPNLEQRKLEIFRDAIDITLFHTSPRHEILKNKHIFLRVQRKLLRDIDFEVTKPLL